MWMRCWQASASTRRLPRHRSWRFGTRPIGSTPQRLSEVERGIARADRPPVLISALTGEGIDALLAAIDARLGAGDEVLTLEIPARDGRLLSWLHDNADVLEQETGESGAVTARFRIDPAIRGKLEGLLKRAGLAASPSPHSSVGRGSG